MKAGTKVELPLWLGEMLAVAGGYVFWPIFYFLPPFGSPFCVVAAGIDQNKAKKWLIISKFGSVALNWAARPS